MKSSYVVAHNNNGYAYIREVQENSTTVYCDCELGDFDTFDEAESFASSVTAELEAAWLETVWEAGIVAVYRNPN